MLGGLTRRDADCCGKIGCPMRRFAGNPAAALESESLDSDLNYLNWNRVAGVPARA